MNTGVYISIAVYVYCSVCTLKCMRMQCLHTAVYVHCNVCTLRCIYTATNENWGVYTLQYMKTGVYIHCSIRKLGCMYAGVYIHWGVYMLHYESLPHCAATSFFRSPTVSSGLHLTRILRPSRSFKMTSIIFLN